MTVSIFGMLVEVSKLVNSGGLVLDIGGALLLIKYSLPDSISREGHSFLVLEQEDEEEKKKWRKYNNWSKVGAGLLVCGFLLQLISNFL